MDASKFLLTDEPQPDDEATERITLFPLAGMGLMVTLVSPDGNKHWVRKGSMVWRVMMSHGYRVGGKS